MFLSIVYETTVVLMLMLSSVSLWRQLILCFQWLINQTSPRLFMINNLQHNCVYLMSSRVFFLLMWPWPNLGQGSASSTEKKKPTKHTCMSTCAHARTHTCTLKPYLIM